MQKPTGFSQRASAQARAALHATERYYDLVQTLDAIVWEADAATLRFTFVSERAEAVLGFPAEDWIGDPEFWTKHIHPDDRERVLGSRQAAGRLGQGYEELYRATAADGRVVWLRDLVRAVGAENGQPAVLRGITIDVTERKEVEAALRSSEARTAGILEAALDAIITIDHTGSVIEWNPAAERIFGYERQDAIGREMAELIIPPTMRDAHRRGLRAYLAGGPGPVIGKRLELTAVRADGGEFPAEIAITRIPGDGPPVFTGHLRDITRRRRDEASLRHELEFTTALLDTVGALVCLLDPEGRFVRFNRMCEAVTGYRLDEVKGRRIWETVLVREEAERARQVFERLRAGDFPVKYESTWIAKDGTRRLISWSTTCLLGEEGGVRFVIGTGLDVTDQRRLEGELRQSQKMDALGRLAGGVAHDFNNLLTIITGYAERLGRPTLAPEAHARAVREVAAAADRAKGLTHQLLAFSRKQAVDTALLDLNAIVLDVDRMLQRVIGEDVELVTVAGADLGKIRANRGQVEQVILNLAVNARDAMPGGGKLTIETANADVDEEYARRHVVARPGPYVMLAVTDSGVGMSPEVQSKIFEPFFTTKEPGRGTGLGLSTVYGIVKQRGGHIWVYSEPGRGTTFKIYFPRERGAAEAEAAAKPVAPARGGTETVLVVEDEDAIRTLARETLGQAGYAVLEANDGQAALKIARTHEGPIDLVLTDVIMPRMGGRELVAALRKLRPEARVLFVSGYADAAVIHQEAIDPGTAYLQKPFTPDGLARRVRDVLDAASPRPQG